MTYKHSQFGKIIILLVILLEAITVAIVMAWFSRSEINSLVPILLPVEFVALILLLFFFRLTVVIEERRLMISFGIGILRKSWNLDEIVSVTSVRNKWWYGFGIRLTPYGWLYNIAGLKAVEIEKKNGKTFRIGTDEPEVLKTAIDTARRVV